MSLKKQNKKNQSKTKADKHWYTYLVSLLVYFAYSQTVLVVISNKQLFDFKCQYFVIPNNHFNIKLTPIKWALVSYGHFTCPLTWMLKTGLTVVLCMNFAVCTP